LMNSSPDCSPKSAEARQPGGTPKAVTDDTQIIKSRPAATLVGIVLFKLGKGILFLGVALALYALSDNNLPEEFLAIVEKLHLNPETKLAANILRQLGRITEANMLWVAGGTLAYAALALLEGVGLFLRHSWAAYLAIAESAFFIPIEVYDLGHVFTYGMLFLLSVNVLIVAYLWRNRKRLFRHHHHHEARPPKDGTPD
jgi:uncharacterized membrane protein (DUF2068 family)